MTKSINQDKQAIKYQIVLSVILIISSFFAIYNILSLPPHYSGRLLGLLGEKFSFYISVSWIMYSQLIYFRCFISSLALIFLFLINVINTEYKYLFLKIMFSVLIVISILSNLFWWGIIEQSNVSVGHNKNLNDIVNYSTPILDLILLLVVLLVSLARLNIVHLKSMLKSALISIKKYQNTDRLSALRSLISKEDATAKKIDSKYVPFAIGLYGLSPDNPICCGNMYRMEQLYKRILYKGKKISRYNTAAFYSTSGKLGIRSRNYIHTEFDDGGEIPTLYFTKEFYYKDYRMIAPTHENLSISDKS